MAAYATTQAGLIRALSRPDTIADAWRISQQEVRESVRFIANYRGVLSEKDEMLNGKWRKHSAAYVEACRVNLQTSLKRYLRHVRQITESEESMTALGIPFAQSSDAWSEADLRDTHPRAA